MFFSVDSMHFVAGHVDGAQGARRTDIFAGAAAGAALCIHCGHLHLLTVRSGVINQADAAVGTVPLAVGA